jgi:hypothetical protein
MSPSQQQTVSWEMMTLSSALSWAQPHEGFDALVVGAGIGDAEAVEADEGAAIDDVHVIVVVAAAAAMADHNL